MRIVLLLLLGVLTGCAGRGILDMGVSAVSGRDCSIVRLDRGQTYCAPPDGPDRLGPYCTRSLGVVDCWADPGLLPARQQEVADGPGPTPEQLRYRAARWPKSLTAF
ncbi:MAG: hypothetical protein JOZ05_18050 [Acetobacteraceae bacterium]|nr:hypothetical protein [Acetobacteraceae bacterium]